MTRYVYLNDSFVPEEKALIHANDLAFQRGYGVFDFFRVKESRPVFLPDHLDRFYRSANGLHLSVPLNRLELEARIEELIQRNDCTNAGIRVGLTGGLSPDGFTMGVPNLLLSQRPFSEPSNEQRAAGMRLLSYSYQRQLAEFKTIDYLMAVWLQPWLKEKGADDVLYHQNGWISECPRSNFFLLTGDGVLVTPADNVLHGITRKQVLTLAKAEYNVEERPVHLPEVETATEAFVTSTTKGVLPVRQVDGKRFSQTTAASRLQTLLVAAMER